jgi:hypothetical protein
LQVCANTVAHSWHGRRKAVGNCSQHRRQASWKAGILRPACQVRRGSGADLLRIERANSLAAVGTEDIAALALFLCFERRRATPMALSRSLTSGA